jgi:hypothetical protein
MAFIKVLSLSVLTLAMVAGALSPAHAIPTIDYGLVAPTTGSLAYAGGSAALVGTDIGVDNVTGLQTPSNDGVTRSCFNCLLNFTTGALTSSWNWGGPGSISLEGSIPGAGIFGSTNLFSGTFTNASVVTLSGVTVVALTNFSATNNVNVTNFFGLPSGPGYVGTINLSFQVPVGTVIGGAFNTLNGGQLLSGDVAINTPELTSILLLGSGLAGIGWFNRKIRKAA